MNFSEALKLLKGGAVMRREGWRSPYITRTGCDWSDVRTEIKLVGTVFWIIESGVSMVWFPNTTDILSSDWITIKEPTWQRTE